MLSSLVRSNNVFSIRSERRCVAGGGKSLVKGILFAMLQ